MIRGRSFIAAFTACLIVLFLSAPVYPSYNTEAGRKYTIACQRLEDLRKSSKKKKYRSYWIDCIRTFEMVEKRYSKSPSAGDACFDRAGLYQDLYLYNRYSKDLKESIQLNAHCQATYPKHARAPEALYHIIELSQDYRKDNASASEIYVKLSQLYPENLWTEKAKARMQPVRTTVKKKKQEPELRKGPVSLIPSKSGPAGVIKSIRFWSGGAYTRIVIDQDKLAKFHTLELKDRLVFDLLNAHLGNEVNREPLLVNDGILKQVRASQFSADTVRVVLDLASIKSYAAFPLNDPDRPRLVIDVTGESTGVAAGGAAITGDTGTAITGPISEDRKIDQKTATQPAAPQSGPNNDGDRLTLSRQLGMKVKTIAIDAGHGGRDPGAIGKSGLREKTVTLDIAKRLAALVKERLGCTVVMTREKDVFIPLDERPFIAKSRNSDLFVSIHVNANRKRNTKGIETYVQGLKATDREAMATAARENAMSQRSLGQLDNEVERMLKDLKTDNKIEESIQLAGVVQASLVENAKPIQKSVVNHGVKSAFFYVLMNTNIPSILAEVGFISNPDEEKLLRKESYRQSIAEALYQGVKKYVDGMSPQMMGI